MNYEQEAPNLINLNDTRKWLIPSLIPFRHINKKENLNIEVS